MTSKKQRKQMVDYLADRLKGSDDPVEQISREIIPGTGVESDYITVGEKGAVLLVDRVYPNGLINKIGGWFRNEGDTRELAFVFLKDGKTFFRNAAERHDFKRKYDLSLKHYSPVETHRMILFRPEEIDIAERRDNWLQYYQPASDGLQEGLETFKFGNVDFDYSHLEGQDFRPADTESKRLHIWLKDKRSHFNGPLKLEGNFLKKR